jgi:predicted nucleic acid-binding protein
MFAWADTSFLYALFAKNDQNHVKAQAIWGACIKHRVNSVVSNLIVSELGTLLAYRFDHAIALRNVRMVLDSAVITKIYVDSEVETASLAWWGKYRDQKFSMVDCVSFELMRRTGIRKALSFDLDFSIAGFERVIGPHMI